MSDHAVPGSGLALLPADGNSSKWTEKQRAIMDALGLLGEKKRRMIQGEWQDVHTDAAPAGVVEMFLSQARRLGLDPMARQIYCIQRGGKWGIQASIDGFRLIAERSGKYQGQTAPQWCGPDGVWHEIWLQDEAPAGARVGIHKDGFTAVTWGVATFAGYCPRDKDGNLAPTNQWKTNPANQLAKCAEMLALRKAFPQDLSGIYGEEEMDQASVVDITATAQDVTGQEGYNPEPANVVVPSEEAVKVWTQWKEAIDAAPDKQALGVLYQQAKDLLNKTIPDRAGITDDSIVLVGDYFMVTAAALPDAAEVGVTKATPAQEPAPEPEATDTATGEVTGGEPPQTVDEPVTEWAAATPGGDAPAESKADGDDVPF